MRCDLGIFFCILDGALADDTPGLKVNIKELDDVLLRDVGNRIKDSEK